MLAAQKDENVNIGGTRAEGPAYLVSVGGGCYGYSFSSVRLVGSIPHPFHRNTFWQLLNPRLYS